MFLFLVIGIIQSLIVSIGNIFLLKVSVAEPFLLITLCVGISLVFQSIVFSFVYLIGNAGKVLAILLLVIQLSASSGTFPVELTNSFFVEVHPFLPFTYAINAVREAVGGVVPSVLYANISVLISIFIATLLFA